jgi:flagellar motor switch protein FliG
MSAVRKINPELTNRRKAAIIVAVLGPKISGEVLKYLTPDQVESITFEMARLEKVGPETRQRIIDEFHELAQAQDFIAEGGVDNARKALVEAFGEEAANEMMQKVVDAMQVVPFDFLKRADAQQLLGFIQDEHPQTIALILAFMPISQSAEILSRLPTDLRADVAARIAMMDQTPPDVIRQVEKVLERKVSNVINTELSKAGGPKALVELLGRVDRTTERLILEQLSDSHPELADEVRNMMFTFEDVVGIDDRAIQTLLREVDGKDLATALKGVGPDVREKIFRNMSERAVNQLKEEMEFMGPVKVKMVEESQKKIVSAIRRLEENGDIQLGRGEEDILV